MRPLVIDISQGEEVVIGDPANPVGNIRVTSVMGNKVRLSFDFPKDIGIARAESAQGYNDSTGEDASDPNTKGAVSKDGVLNYHDMPRCVI